MGQKYVPELHDPNFRMTGRQKGKSLSDDEAERLFDAVIAKLDAEERAAHRASQNCVLGRQCRSADIDNDAEREGYQIQTDAELRNQATRSDARLAARPLYESADQKWMIRLFPLI